VAQCRQKFGATARYAVMDGERPAVADERFDLVVANLAAQWFADLPAALLELSRRLAPGGRLALTTLGGGTFSEWRTAHAALNLAAATPDFPDATRLAAAFPEDMRVTVTEETHVETFAEPLHFLHGLRRVGADTPVPGRRPLPVRQMRQVLRHFAAVGNAASYHVLYAIATRSRQGQP
jgi:malonyl-CoA O-methyltransferase